MISASDYDITYYGRDKKMDAKRSRYMSEVAKRMLALPSGPLFEADMDADIWRYRYYGDWLYVKNFPICRQRRWLLGGADTWTTRTQYVRTDQLCQPSSDI